MLAIKIKMPAKIAIPPDGFPIKRAIVIIDNTSRNHIQDLSADLFISLPEKNTKEDRMTHAIP